MLEEKIINLLLPRLIAGTYKNISSKNFSNNAYLMTENYEAEFRSTSCSYSNGRSTLLLRLVFVVATTVKVSNTNDCHSAIKSKLISRYTTHVSGDKNMVQGVLLGDSKHRVLSAKPLPAASAPSSRRKFVSRFVLCSHKNSQFSFGAL